MNTQNRIKQEISAGRIQSPPYHHGFDSALPPNVPAQLQIPPRRPRILGPHKPVSQEPPAKHWLLLAIFLLALALLANLFITLHRQDQKPAPLALPSPTPQTLPPT